VAIILPNERKRRAPVDLWVPDAARVAHRCRLCGTEFTRADVEADRHLRHVAGCAVSHTKELEAIKHRHNETLMERPAWADLEYEDWIKKRAREQRERGEPFTARRRLERNRPI
jgi:hypothetical protein